MLNIIKLTNKFEKGKDTAMLLGGFDGLHAGHRQLLSYAKNSGLPVGIMTIIGGKGEKSLFTAYEREMIFKENGIDFIFELPFLEIKDLSPEQFIELLEKECTPNLFVCGEDFRFGAGAKGRPETIKERGQVRVEVQPLLKIEGEKVSSTTVKRYVENGDVKRVHTLLGSPFSLRGKVVKGRQVGRGIGFPTANVAYPQDKFPLKLGVYQTEITIDGKAYKGITNYGARPTFDNVEVWTETHLIDYQGDLYGKSVLVKFVDYLRDIKKFDSVEALQNQLEEDKRRVMEND